MGLEDKIEKSILESHRKTKRVILESSVVGSLGFLATFAQQEKIVVDTLQGLEVPLHYIVHPAYWSIHGEFLFRSSAIGLCMYGFTWFSCNLLSTFGLQTMKHFPKLISLFLRNSFRRQIDKTKEISLETSILPHIKDPLMRLRVEISRDIFLGKIDSAFETAKTLLLLHQNDNLYSHPFRSLQTAAENLLIRSSSFHSHPLTQIEQGISHMTRGHYNSATKHFARAAALPSPHSLETNCFYGYVLDVFSRLLSSPKKREIYASQARAQWEKTIRSLLADKERMQYFQPVGDSRNEVLIGNKEGFLPGTFVFKKNAFPSYLEREWTLTNLLDNLFQKKPTFVHPLAYIHVDSVPVYASWRVHGKTLTEALHDPHEEPTLLLQKAIDTLQYIHRVTNANKHLFPTDLMNERQYLPFLVTKFVQRVTQDVALQQHLTDALSFLTDILEQQPKQVIHGDFHPNNIIYHNKGLTILDPEHMTLALRELDLVDLLESHLFSVDPALCQQLLRSAYDTMENPKPSFDEWLLSRYIPGGAYRNLHRIGAVSASTGTSNLSPLLERKEHYRQRTLHHLAALRNMEHKFYDPSRRLEEFVSAF